jgi:diketogulonate reductase-like aldo/keto reductase
LLPASLIPQLKAIAMAVPPPRRSQNIPEIIYGTAFKFDKSKTLVEAALNAGFRAIDTAGSKSAYRDALVGEGIAAALATGTFQRSDLYVCNPFLISLCGSIPFYVKIHPILYV